jgi:hypothetical protein
MPSLFSRLYSQRPSEARNQLENFLTEAFAFALERDAAFRSRWISSLNWRHSKQLGDCQVNTQSLYPDGQPDIELRSVHFRILVECKIESPEGQKQLDRYSQILSMPVPETGKIFPPEQQILVYLTKHYDPKQKPIGFKGHFAVYRWHQVFELIALEDENFTVELKHFLKELDMSQNDNFTYHDLDALLTIHGTIRKMDKALDIIRPIAKNELDANFIPSNRSTSLQRDPAYYNNAFYDFTHIDLGFAWWAGDSEVYLYAAHLVHKKTEAAFGQFEKVKQFSSDNNWDYSPTDSRWHSWFKTKPISQILTGNLDHIQSIEQWFKERLDEWIALKQIVPPFFKLSKGGSALASEISSVE